VRIWHVEELMGKTVDQVLLDVRTPAEVQAGTIPGAMNIPVDELRGRLSELPCDKELLVFCQVGLRGYLALPHPEPAWPALPQSVGRIQDLHGVGRRGAREGSLGQARRIERCRSASPSAGAGECCCVANGAGAASASCCGTGGAQATGALCADKAPVKEIDARALQCPGPIMRLREELDAVEAGSAVAVLAADPAFPRDIRAWCHSTGHTLLDVAPVNGHVRATIRKNARPAVAAAPSGAINSKSKSILVFSGDLDKRWRLRHCQRRSGDGSDVTMFFTFWGLNVLRRPEKVKTSKNLIERMFGWMMPRGRAGCACRRCTWLAWARR